MAPENLNITPEDIDNLVVAWLNLLSAYEMDRFFWDYPNPSDYTKTTGFDYRKGYGLGITTARRIVAGRRQLAGGFSSIDQVKKVPGIGKDKIYDMRCQAREALALAAYYSIPYDPGKLWILLIKEGPGTSLNYVIETFKKFILCSLHYNKSVSDAVMKKVSLNIPFVGLTRVWHRRQVRQFNRVRIKPWAFAVYGKESQWLLKLEFVPGEGYKTFVEKVI